jgi:hypothetical protein
MQCRPTDAHRDCPVGIPRRSRSAHDAFSSRAFLLGRSHARDPNLKRITRSCQASSDRLRNQYRVPRRAFGSGASRPTEKKRSSLRRSSASQLDECQLRCADQAHNVYRLVEPTLEIHPCTGAPKHSGSVMTSICPPESQWPVALVKRPVPPVTSEVSWLSYTPGVSVGLR